MKHKLKNNVPVGLFSHYTMVFTVQIIFYYIVLTYNVQVILETLIEKSLFLTLLECTWEVKENIYFFVH